MVSEVFGVPFPAGTMAAMNDLDILPDWIALEIPASRSGYPKTARTRVNNARLDVPLPASIL
jgi:hypothetical protein